jgi:hypothetical protein
LVGLVYLGLLALISTPALKRPLLRPFLCFEKTLNVYLCQLIQLAVKGIPVGLIQPIFHESRMHKNSTTDMPTRKARARIIRLDLGASSVSPRNMNNNAVDKAANMPKKAIAINIFMSQIIL